MNGIFMLRVMLVPLYPFLKTPSCCFDVQPKQGDAYHVE